MRIMLQFDAGHGLRRNNNYPLGHLSLVVNLCLVTVACHLSIICLYTSNSSLQHIPMTKVLRQGLASPSMLLEVASTCPLLRRLPGHALQSTEGTSRAG